MMNVLYIMTSPALEKDGIIKFGMSQNPAGRLCSYSAVFAHPKFIFCFVLPANYTKKEILWLEKNILCQTEHLYAKQYASEYRVMTISNIYNIVVNFLNDIGAEYKILENHIFEVPEKKNYEQLSNNELDDILLTDVPERFKQKCNIAQIKIKLYEYQKKCLQTFKNLLEKNTYFQGIYLLATGLGKSYIQLACCLYHLEKYPEDNILWLCFRNDIIDSQKNLLSKFQDKIIYCHHGQYDINKLKNIKGKIVVMLRQSLKENKLPENIFHGLMHDECHDGTKKSMTTALGEVIDGKTFDLLQQIKKNNSLKYRIGFSATPLTKSERQNAGVLDLYGMNNRICYLSKISLVEGVQLGKLLKPLIEYVMFNTKLFNLTELYQLLEEKSVNDKYQIMIIKMIDEIQKYINKMVYKKGIIWFPTIKTQQFFFKKIKEQLTGMDVYISNSNINNDDERFRTQESNCLMIACDKFTTGFDGVNMEFGINCVLNETGERVIQKLGRFTRNNKPRQLYAHFAQFCEYSEDNDMTNLIDSIVRNSEALGIKTCDFVKDFHKSSSNNKLSDFTLMGCIDISVSNKIFNFEELRKMIILRKSSKNIGYEKAKKIIRIYKEIDNLILESESDYQLLCDKDPRLPKDPESYFVNKFNWIDYLSIDRTKYYNSVVECQNALNKIQNRLTIKEIEEQYNYCRSIDSKIPPMPIHFYGSKQVPHLGILVESSLQIKQKRKLE